MNLVLIKYSYSPTPINGLVALEAGFLVCLKQLVVSARLLSLSCTPESHITFPVLIHAQPEHTVSLFKGFIRMRIKHFPAAFVIANMLSGPLLGTDTALWLSLFGFATSWIYLRFYRISEISSAATGGESTIMKGDASDTFAFVAFFPDAVHPFLAPICDAIYNNLVQLRICTPFSEEAIGMSNEHAASRSDAGLPSIMDRRSRGGGRRAEAERRRALALKALDQRLNAAGPGRSSTPAVTTVQATLATDRMESSPAKDEPAIEAAPATQSQAQP